MSDRMDVATFGGGAADAAAARELASKRRCFAGETCSLEDYSTAHGAWLSRLAAAAFIERGLPR
jgi:monoamine oxidase